jgi:hypothetical protein
VADARRWLTHPSNWFESELFIIKWDGLVPRISRRHGQRLLDEPWDDGLPEVVLRQQREARKCGSSQVDETQEATDGDQES